jgi:hypothetical protein
MKNEMLKCLEEYFGKRMMSPLPFCMGLRQRVILHACLMLTLLYIFIQNKGIQQSFRKQTTTMIMKILYGGNKMRHPVYLCRI